MMAFNDNFMYSFYLEKLPFSVEVLYPCNIHFLLNGTEKRFISNVA